MRMRIPLLVGGALTVLTAVFLWFTLLSPFGYQPPAGVEPIDDARPHRVFVYGTLRWRAVRWLVIGRTGEPEPAVLPGFERRGLDIVPDHGGQVAGLVLEVDADELRRLDRYERAGVRYDRVLLPLEDEGPAWVYRRTGYRDR